MIAICLAVYFLIGVVFIGSLAIVASRPAPRQFSDNAIENEPEILHQAEPVLRHAA